VKLAGVDLGARPFDYERALAQVPPDYRKNLFMLNSPLFFVDRARQADFALRNRMASMFGLRQWVEAGGLMSYGASLTWMYSHAADYVDRIARGPNPPNCRSSSRRNSSSSSISRQPERSGWIFRPR
jgi:hypothetical protein